MIRLTDPDTAFTLTIPANTLGVLCDLAGICHRGEWHVFVSGKPKKPRRKKPRSKR